MKNLSYALTSVDRDDPQPERRHQTIRSVMSLCILVRGRIQPRVVLPQLRQEIVIPRQGVGGAVAASIVGVLGIIGLCRERMLSG